MDQNRPSRVPVPGNHASNLGPIASATLGKQEAKQTRPGTVDIRSDLARIALQPIEHEFDVGDRVFVTLDKVVWHEGVVIQCPPSDLKFDPPPSESGPSKDGVKQVSLDRNRYPLKSILRNGATRCSAPSRPYYKQWLVQVQDGRSQQSECILSPLEGQVKPQTPFYSLIIQNLPKSEVLQTSRAQSKA